MSTRTWVRDKRHWSSRMDPMAQRVATVMPRTSPTKTNRVASQRRSKGGCFTLIEMIVTVTVLVIVVLAVAPSLVSMKATSDRRDVISAIRRIGLDARERAIESGKTTQIVSDDSAGE